MRALAKLTMTLLILVVVASVAHAGAGLTWRIMGLTPTAPPRAASRAPRVVEALDIGPILALAPFGSAIPIEPEPELVDAKEDWLTSLSLRGVIVAVPASRSLAMIVIDGGAVGTFAVGQSPLPGVTIETVGKDRVVFAANGSQVPLGFATDEEKRIAGVSRLRNAIPEKFRNNTQKGPAGGRVDGVIDFYRQKIRANPQTVLDGFGVARIDGGYRVGTQPSIGVTRAGLQPGDVIAKVNGQAVGNIEADRRLFEKVAAARHARVEILRDGRRIILSFPLK